MALGRQAEIPGPAGLWRSPGGRGRGADSCPLLHWVSPTRPSPACSWPLLAATVQLLPTLPPHRRQAPEEWSIGLGAGPEEQGLKQLILHGAYTHPEGGYDVAFLLLAQPVTLGPHLRPLCLPYADHQLPDGKRGWVLGLPSPGAGNRTRSGHQLCSPNLEATTAAEAFPLLCRYQLPLDSACDPSRAKGMQPTSHKPWEQWHPHPVGDGVYQCYR